MTQVSRISQLVHILRFDGDLSSQTSFSPDVWGDLAITAIALGLAPLLYVRTASLDLPPAARAKLSVTYSATQKRNHAIARQLGEMLAAMHAAGIETMVLKGGYLAFQLYPDPALRGMSDLDLLFRPAELPAAEMVLQSLGYEGKHKSADEGPGIVKHTSTYKRADPDAVTSTPNPYLSTAGDRHVDPHGSLEESWFGLRVDVTPGIWQRSRPVTLVDQPARAMADEDLLLHLSVHLVYHLLMSKPSLVQLYDIALGSQTLPLNWETLAARARDCQAVPFLYAALHLARTVYGTPVPAGTLAALRASCPSRQAQRIERMGLADVVQQTQRPPLVTIGQRLARGVSDRRETAQWAPSLAGKWAVWRTAIDIGKTDTGKLLGEKLSGGQRFNRRRTGNV